MYREGLDTEITLCSLDPFRNPTVVLPDESCDETRGPPENCLETAQVSGKPFPDLSIAGMFY